MEDDIIQLIQFKFDTSKIKFATRSIQKNPKTKLLVINNKLKEVKSDSLDNIEAYFDEGDVIVINQSGTIPGSMQGKVMRTNEDIEIRLAGWVGTDFTCGYNWKAITFAGGDWRQKTEDRKDINNLFKGDIITFQNGLFMTVKEIFVKPGKFIQIEFQTDISSEELWNKIYEIGTPIQYSYLEDQLAIWDQQTLFSGPPLSLEPPSASFQFSWSLINKLIRKGVIIVPISHSAGISSTGNTEVDSYLPLPEIYEVNKKSADSIQNAKMEGKKIIALGTSVVRALEAIASKNEGKIVPSKDITNFVIHQNYQTQVVTGIISGMHIPEESHMQIMLAFTTDDLLLDGYNLAVEDEYHWHEYGDLTLVY
ncbi:MAG: S-adenosylmethionine:tRNA ribosyltransferase-isomerase [Candidatus Heimdallarchaeota archaeon]|nr:S-adenosylmethionine:tRNA ribosyltransferase-isomerase [Candidatus Heimdallarchaeota archaeon]